MYQAVPSPSGAREPGVRCGYRRSGQWRRDDATPSLEPSRRRAGVEAHSAAYVLAEVLEDVDEGIPNLARLPQHVRVIPSIPNAPSPSQHAVDGSRDANGNALHTAREPRRRIRLHEQMEMIGLDAEVDEAKGVPRGRAKGASYGPEQRMAA
jgi:hypothetical protein